MLDWIASLAARLLGTPRRAASTGDGEPGTQADGEPAEPGFSGGFSLRFGAPPPSAGGGAPERGFTWSFQSTPVASRIFRVDEAQLHAAREARAAGESWEAISRSVNPEYDTLTGVERDFYRRALEMAVEQDRAGRPE